MNSSGRSVGQMAAAIALAVVLGTLAVDRASGQMSPPRSPGYDRGHHDHDHERVSVEGRIRSIHRDRDWYRVELDHGGYSFWVPERSLRGHSGDFRVGRSVRFGGLSRGGMITVDLVDWPPYLPVPDYRRSPLPDDRRLPLPDERRSVNGIVRGVIERIDYQRDFLVLRKEDGGRLVTINVIRADRRWNRTFDFYHLRRGDLITLSGEWTPAGRFDAYRIESVQVPRH